MQSKLITWSLAFPALYVLFFATVRADEETETLYREGKKAFRSCAACHFVNEPNLKEDEDWLNLNKVTACISAGDLTPRIRKALDVFFRSDETRRPLLVDENYKPNDNQACGKLKVPETSGTAFLKTERESIRKGAPPKIRLYWKASQAGKILTVPAGKYRVIGYRYFRKAKDNQGELWTLSVTDLNGCTDLVISEDGIEDFDLAPVMNGTLSAEENKDGIKFSLALRNETNSTMTLSKNGEMCLPRFVVKDSSGKKVYENVFENT